MTIRAVLYCRVSTSSQSVERQIRELTDIAKGNDWGSSVMMKVGGSIKTQ